MAGDHAVQAILWTAMDLLSIHFAWYEKELTPPEGCGNNHVILHASQAMHSLVPRPHPHGEGLVTSS